RGSVLVGWAGGECADPLVPASQEEIAALGFKILAKLFSTPADKIRQQISSIYYHNWAEDPFSRGAYSYIPVNGLILPKLLAAPVAGTLFFAGEATATDAQLGTVFAALETGYRAAREIKQA
ncbi:MAG: FAD-dependent oxidoreductase, partial [Limisphaerales bacterium]